ncbi:septum formation initiator family protein [Tuanshanicoccus lijuaniae]|uniref:FtsB family cell division protein n=1 Tax=Aerococcaceae bacterium zg-1292 TaxID=2774330 RepID=UPI0019359171|nr:septum formation initiator family protein [Aerococcaceae bacterium zg-1292]MBF6978867.1 septum formation initiator family protein [Aerococcaceae bacterium zg-BR22]MBS4455301.1 septum formation initiator family protein [Aerococcaceae bacterium zg-A91]MBS4457889.1 septum formation initiator family protein [Aerococcaceae bacterium zg-BR33]QQA36790.1 septum formation initiator family protein [Aerococcaceae bacterium zg-1292]
MKNNREDYPTQSQQQKKNRVSKIVLLFCLSIIGVSSWSLWQVIEKKEEMMMQLTQAQTANKKAVEKNRQAQQEYQQAQDEDYLAQVARRDYYYSKPGEIIFDLKKEVETTSNEQDN